MEQKRRKYDIILQNCATKQEYIVEKLENSSKNGLYLQFDGFSMPEGAPDGEYRYYLIANQRDDVEYELIDDILKSKVKVGDDFECKLWQLNPIMGLMKYGEEIKINNYRVRNVDYIYYEKRS